MAKISLRAYDREIEGLIEHGHKLDEAVAHCRHILQSYPKHVETYRLLGKCYLEAKRYDHAVDIFQRVLVVVPDDFVSHVGMSIIADDQGKLDDAIWHMERAFEVQPSNAAIQGELQRLFGRRDGVEPPKIRLTRGALAHMYVHGELFTQAISEIRAVLSHDPKRADMQLLLAAAYFRSGQKNEAARVCAELLGKYPYCLEANRLMVEILVGTPKADSAQEYRKRVNELDPYAAFAQDSVLHTENVPESAVTIDRLEYTGQAAEGGSTLGIGLEAAQTGARSELPAWLTGTPAAAPVAPEAEPTKQELPSFMTEAGWTEVESESQSTSDEESEFEPAAAPADLPAWVKALAPTEDSEGTSVPDTADLDVTQDWLRDLRAEPVAPEAPAPGVSMDGQAPDWLGRLGSHDLDKPISLADSQPAVPESVETAAQAEEAPGWLKDFDRDLEEPLQNAQKPAEEPLPPLVESKPAPESSGLGKSAKEQDDALAWLESLAEKHGARPEEMVTPPGARTDVAPEWVDKARQLGEENADTWASLRAASEEAIPAAPSTSPDSWFDSDAENASADIEEKPAASASGRQPYDWFSGLADKDAFSRMTGQPSEELTPPDRSQVVPGMAARPTVGQEPAWFEGEPPVEPEPHLDSSGPESGKDETGVSLPEWLAGLDNEPPRAAAAVPEESIPAWMQPEGAPAPETATPTQSADWQPAERDGASAAGQPPASLPQVSAPMKAAPVPERAKPARTPAPQPASAGPVTSASRPISASLGSAQSELGRGNIAAALEVYGRLIRKGKSLEEIIRDLRDALYRYPVEVPIWQALGDAYMRANRLQEALDAYTKAEELLR